MIFVETQKYFVQSSVLVEKALESDSYSRENAFCNRPKWKALRKHNWTRILEGV